MATLDTSEVTIGFANASGAIYVAVEGTEPPTDGITALDTSVFKLLGYTSDAGVQISESGNSQSIRAWEGLTEVYSVRTEYTESVSFTPIQCNSDVVALTWGSDHVSVDSTTGAIAARHHGEALDPVVIVIETVPRPGKVRRYVGTFRLNERGAVTLNGTGVDGRQLTFNAIADEDGVTMYEYNADTE